VHLPALDLLQIGDGQRGQLADRLLVEGKWLAGRGFHAGGLLHAPKEPRRPRCRAEIDRRGLNTLHYAPRHYLDIALVADWAAGEPEIREPDKVDGWVWYSLDALPSPLFHMVPTAIEALRGERRMWDGP